MLSQHYKSGADYKEFVNCRVFNESAIFFVGFLLLLMRLALGDTVLSVI